MQEKGKGEREEERERKKKAKIYTYHQVSKMLPKVEIICSVS